MRGAVSLRRREQPERLSGLYAFILLLFPPHKFAEACVGEGASDALLLCGTCGRELAYERDINSVPSRLALSNRSDAFVGDRRVQVQLFENPHGLRFEVVTLRRADVTKHWPADERFSWFPGYSWTMASCPRCKTHLGWAFQPSDWPDTVPKTKFEESAQTFLALIIRRLLREDFASSLLLTPKSFMS